MPISIEQLVEPSGVRFGTSGARGLVANMTDEVCFVYVAAFLQAVVADSPRIALGCDLRPSSLAIAAACAAAIRHTGGEVVWCGRLPTPALAYFAQHMNMPAVMVTGSHIPFNRNGIKFYRADGEISKADEQAMMKAVVEVPDALRPMELPEADEVGIRTYVQRYLDFFPAGMLAGMRLAVYEHSSVARDVLREILEALGATVISLGRTETFVPIDTEAVSEADARQAQAWAQEYGFDAIFSTDGDGDRPLIGNEQGRWLRGDVVGILCARYLDADVVVTPVSSNTVVEKCGWFKTVVSTRIGSPYVIEGMDVAAERVRGSSGPDVDAPPHPNPSPEREEGLVAVSSGGRWGDIVVGYEANGGFLLGSEVVRGERRMAPLPTRDAVLPILALLAMAKERGCAMSQLTDDLPSRFTASDRLQDFSAERSQALLAQLRLSPAAVVGLLRESGVGVFGLDETDGLRMTFSNGEIMHFRPSGNAPELRCYTEADAPDRARVLCERGLRWVAENVGYPAKAGI